MVGKGFVRFVAVGMANTCVHYAAYLTFWRVLGVLTAHLVAAVVAMQCSYLLNCRCTFGVPLTLRTFLLYPISNLSNLVSSAAAFTVLMRTARVDPRLATLAGGVLALPVTFLVSRAVLVGSTGKPEDTPLRPHTMK